MWQQFNTITELWKAILSEAAFEYICWVLVIIFGSSIEISLSFAMRRDRKRTEREEEREREGGNRGWGQIFSPFPTHSTHSVFISQLSVALCCTPIIFLREILHTQQHTAFSLKLAIISSRQSDWCLAHSYTHTHAHTHATHHHNSSVWFSVGALQLLHASSHFYRRRQNVAVAWPRWEATWKICVKCLDKRKSAGTEIPQYRQSQHRRSCLAKDGGSHDCVPLSILKIYSD